jgi:hypothetical protein
MTASNTRATGDQIGARTGFTSPTTISVSEGLSSSAKAGIGIGVSLAVVGVICLIAAIILMRRRGRGHMNFGHSNELDAAVESSNPAVGYSFSGKQSWGPSQERKIHELSGHRRKLTHDGPVEMRVPPGHCGC